MSESLAQLLPDQGLLPESSPRPQRSRAKGLPWLRMSLFSAASVAGLAYFAKEAPQQGREWKEIPPVSLVTPPPSWHPLQEPSPSFALDSNAMISARSHLAGGREDTITLKPFGEPAHARLSLLRGLAEPPAGSLYVALVRQAADAGLSVMRSGRPGRVKTKFGFAETLDITLAGDREQTCLGFRYAHSEMPFIAQGWNCGGEEEPFANRELVCLIDRLSFVGTADPALTAFFKQSEGQKNLNCAAPARIATSRPATREPNRVTATR